MKIFAIGDPHLSTVVKKPMDIFGDGWDNHFERISEDWLQKVSQDDVVLIPGDISWGMTEQEAKPDLQLIANLTGSKVITRGNHDYWWKAIGRVREMLNEKMYALQNDCIRFGKVVVLGTKGYTVPEGEFKTEDDKKLHKREIIRLQLALEEMQKIREDDDFIIAMIHYPPFNSKFDESEYMQLYEKYKVNCVVYGHLHGKGCRTKPVVEKNGVRYLLTSCDQVKCKLVSVWEG